MSGPFWVIPQPIFGLAEPFGIAQCEA